MQALYFGQFLQSATPAGVSEEFFRVSCGGFVFSPWAVLQPFDCVQKQIPALLAGDAFSAVISAAEKLHHGFQSSLPALSFIYFVAIDHGFSAVNHPKYRYNEQA